MARAKKSKVKLAERAGEPDPRAALDAAGLLSACQGVLAWLEADLLERTKASPAVTSALAACYEAGKKAERTAESFAAGRRSWRRRSRRRGCCRACSCGRWRIAGCSSRGGWPGPAPKTASASSSSWRRR
jgi:hypothetical protein